VDLDSNTEFASIRSISAADCPTKTAEKALQPQPHLHLHLHLHLQKLSNNMKPEAVYPAARKPFFPAVVFIRHSEPIPNPFKSPILRRLG
jgi:hypothetical protein